MAAGLFDAVRTASGLYRRAFSARDRDVTVLGVVVP